MANRRITSEGTTSAALKLRELSYLAASRHGDPDLPLEGRLSNLRPRMDGPKEHGIWTIGNHTLMRSHFEKAMGDIDDVCLNIAIDGFNEDNHFQFCVPLNATKKIMKNKLVGWLLRNGAKRMPEIFWQSEWQLLLPVGNKNMVVRNIGIVSRKFAGSWKTEISCLFRDEDLLERLNSVLNLVVSKSPPVDIPHIPEIASVLDEGQEEEQMDRLLGLFFSSFDQGLPGAGQHVEHAVARPHRFRDHIHEWLRNAVYEPAETINWIKCTNDKCRTQWWRIPRGGLPEWGGDGFTCRDMGRICGENRSVRQKIQHNEVEEPDLVTDRADGGMHQMFMINDHERLIEAEERFEATTRQLEKHNEELQQELEARAEALAKCKKELQEIEEMTNRNVAWAASRLSADGEKLTFKVGGVESHSATPICPVCGKPWLREHPMLLMDGFLGIPEGMVRNVVRGKGHEACNLWWAIPKPKVRTVSRSLSMPEYLTRRLNLVVTDPRKWNLPKHKCNRPLKGQTTENWVSSILIFDDLHDVDKVRTWLDRIFFFAIESIRTAGSARRHAQPVIHSTPEMNDYLVKEWRTVQISKRKNAPFPVMLDSVWPYRGYIPAFQRLLKDMQTEIVSNWTNRAEKFTRSAFMCRIISCLTRSECMWAKDGFFSETSRFLKSEIKIKVRKLTEDEHADVSTVVVVPQSSGLLDRGTSTTDMTHSFRLPSLSLPVPRNESLNESLNESNEPEQQVPALQSVLPVLVIGTSRKKKRNLESILESPSSSPSTVLDPTKTTSITTGSTTTDIFKKVKFQESNEPIITSTTEAGVPEPITTAKTKDMLLQDPNEDYPWTVVNRYPLDDHQEDQQQQEYFDCSLAAFPAPAAEMENYCHKTNEDSWTTAACDPCLPPSAVPLRLSLSGSPTSPMNTGQNHPDDTASPSTTTIATTLRSVGEDELLGYRPRLVSDAHEAPSNGEESGTLLSSTTHRCSPRTVLVPSIVLSPHEDDEEEDEGTTNYHHDDTEPCGMQQLTNECSTLLVPLWHMTLCLVTFYTTLMILRRITSDPKQTIDYFAVDTHCPLVHHMSLAAGTVLKHYRYCGESLPYWFRNDSATSTTGRGSSTTATTFCHAEDSFLKLLLGDVWVRTASQDSLSLVLKGLQDSWIVFPLYLLLLPTLLAPLDVMIVVLLEFLEHRLGIISGGTILTQPLYRFLQGLVHVLEYPFGILCTICQWSWWGLGTMPYSYYYSVRRALSASSMFQHYHHSTATPTPATVGGYCKRVWITLYEVISTLAFICLVCRVTRLAVVGGYHHNANQESIQHLMDSIRTRWNEDDDGWKSVLESAVTA